MSQAVSTSGSLLSVIVNPGSGSPAECGVTYIESLDAANPAVLRELDSGSYVLYGKFKAYSGNDTIIVFESKLNANIVKSTDCSSIMIFNPVNSKVECLTIYDDRYERTDVALQDVVAHIGQLKNDLSQLAYVQNFLDTTYIVADKTLNPNGTHVTATSAPGYAYVGKQKVESGKKYVFYCLEQTVGNNRVCIYPDAKPVGASTNNGTSITSSAEKIGDYNRIVFTAPNDGWVAIAFYGIMGAEALASKHFGLSLYEEYDGTYYPVGHMLHKETFHISNGVKISEFENDAEYIDQSQLIGAMQKADVMSEKLNMLDPNAIEWGKTINPNNGAASGWSGTPNRWVSPYIPVEYGKEYRMFSSTYGNHSGYTAGKTYIANGISVVHTSEYSTITITDERVELIRFCNIDGTDASDKVFCLSSLYNSQYYEYGREIILPQHIDERRMILSKIPNDAGYIKNPVELSWYKGKKLVSFGDSITGQGRWQKYVKDYFGFASHVNCGIGGSTVANNGNKVDGTPNDQWMCSDYRISTIPSDADVILFFGGHNDWGTLSIPFGTVGETPNDKSFIGAYELTIKKLIQTFPNAKIITMSCVGGRTPTENENPDTQMYLPHDVNGETKNLCMTDFAKACKEVSEYYGIPCIDVGAESGISTLNHTTYIADVIHPNAEGGKLIANAVINGLKRFEPITFA